MLGARNPLLALSSRPLFALHQDLGPAEPMRRRSGGWGQAQGGQERGEQEVDSAEDKQSTRLGKMLRCWFLQAPSQLKARAAGVHCCLAPLDMIESAPCFACPVSLASLCVCPLLRSPGGQGARAGSPLRVPAQPCVCVVSVEQRSTPSPSNRALRVPLLPDGWKAAPQLPVKQLRLY